MDIKPVGYIFETDGPIEHQERLIPIWEVEQGNYNARGMELVYTQSAIDALTAEVERLNACLEVQTENALVLLGMKELADAEAARLSQELAAMKGQG